MLRFLTEITGLSMKTNLGKNPIFMKVLLMTFKQTKDDVCLFYLYYDFLTILEYTGIIDYNVCVMK